MTVHLVVGLPGAGKTTRARQLEAAHAALRLTPDDWLMAIFAGEGPAGWRAADREGQRDRLEGKLIELGLRAARQGLDVVFDFGFWGRDERAALRWIAATAGIEARVEYLPVDPAEQRRRIDTRRADPGQWEMTDAELEQWRRQFEVPDAEELSGGPIPEPLPGYEDWAHWASTRWPSLPRPVWG